MSSFTDLSIEVVALISMEVHPGDIVNFALSSRDLSISAKAALARHHRLRNKYRRIDNRGTPCKNRYLGAIEDGMFLPQVLGSILTDRRIGYYINHLYLKVSPRYPGDLADGCQAYPYHYPDAENKFIDAMVALLPWEDEAERNAPRAMTVGDQNPTLALLLYHSPNLSTLELEIDEGAAGLDLLKLIKRLSAREEAAGLFSNLRRVSLHSGASSMQYDTIPAEFVPTFMAFPSIQYIEADRLAGTDDWHSLTPKRSSEIQELVLTGCASRTGFSAMPEGWLSHILTGTCKLKRFTFRHETSGLPYSLELVVSAILDFTKESLRELSIVEIADVHQDRYYSQSLGDLNPFTNLRYVETSLYLLFEYSPNVPGHVLTQLPLSLEHLIVHEEDNSWACYALNMLTGTIGKKGTLFPNLTKIDLHLKSSSMHIARHPYDPEALCKAKCMDLLNLGCMGHFVDLQLHFPKDTILPMERLALAMRRSQSQTLLAYEYYQQFPEQHPECRYGRTFAGY